MPEITDRESLEAWLKTRPVEDARLIAARAALRVLPNLVTVLDADATDRRTDIVLPVLRALVFASPAIVRPAEATEVRKSVESEIHSDLIQALHEARTTFKARYAINAALHAALSARATKGANAANAIDSSTYVTYNDHFAWEPVSRDVNVMEAVSSRSLQIRKPLWPNEDPPTEIAAAWNQLRRHLLYEAKDEGWEPWVDWYEGILVGDPGWEELEVQKALIPSETWKQGPKVLNAEIKRLTNEFFGRTVPQAEVMRYNRSAQVVEVERTQITPDDALGNAVSKVRDDLDELRPRLDENQLTALRPVVEFLDKTVTDRADLPRRVHDDFERGALSIQQLLDDQEVAKDISVTALQRDLENGIIDLRAAFPDIEKMAEARAKARIKSLTPENLAQVEEAAEAAAEISEAPLAEELREDAKDLVPAPVGESPEPLPDGEHKTAGYRLGGRLLKILRIGEEVTDAPAKLVKNVGLISAAIWAILRLLGL